MTRRSFLVAAGATVLTLPAVACTRSRGSNASGPTGAATTTPSSSPPPLECAAVDGSAGPHAPLWKAAMARGIVYGSSAATWQLSDASYRALFERQAAILFTEDDLLWWRLRPSPDSGLRFAHADRIIDFANDRGMLVFGAHLVWDEGFGDGWTDADLWQIDEKRARELMIGTIDAVLARYRGKVAAWSVVNEAIDSSGLRSDVPWYSTVGPSYVADAFRAARGADPEALLVLNEFGFETDGFDLAADKRSATLRVLDDLLGADVPVEALGVQAHLQARPFLRTFDPDAYRMFLSDVADRGLRILITELDVLDDGLPANSKKRDLGVADVYRTYLDTALDEPAVTTVMTFGLTDRYTWLQEDYPRKDGAPRRPLPYDDRLEPTTALGAVESGLAHAPRRRPSWVPPRC